MCQPGKPATPGRVPLLEPRHPGRAGLPEGEVGRVALVGHVLHAAGGLQLVEVEAGELGVGGEGRHVEVDAVVDAVGAALGLEGADHVDLLGDVARGAGHHVGLEAAEPPTVAGPLLGPVRGDLLGGAALALAAGLDLVVALVGVAGEVAHVGDVGDVGDLVARRRAAGDARGPA